MQNWKIILLATGISALITSFVSIFWTRYRKNQLIKKYTSESEGEKIEKFPNLKEQVLELKSEIWLFESLEVVLYKISKENYRKNLFLENDGLVACLIQKNIENTANTVAVEYLNQEKFDKNLEKLAVSDLNFASFFEPFFDFILISVKIEITEILKFLKILKTDGILIWKYQKNQRRKILRYLKSQKIVFDEYFYYDFLLIKKK
ncbi:BC85_0335 family putative methyltransferase [Mesomycoplasma hyopneumoniae]|uniref:BC85_0335 family putative methyltransferase n=1 Tax=Mesomycoplasma hyopneumoniae TaxID=2099 RepID=UPI0032AF59AB